MADFFDDPDFVEQLARQGIRHQPGMSAELLEQLGPLLKAEGVDLDDPDNPPDLETLNAAMAVAVERHNMHLHTPVGRHRDLALAMLREIAVAIAEGDSDTAVDLFDSIQPEETDVRPAASHVIGVSLGLLDEWFADQSIQRDVLRATVPKLFSKPSRNVARDLLSLAIKGRATGSLDQLIRRNGGLVVAEAGVLAVAGVLIARAKASDLSVAELGAKVLTAIELPANRSGASFSAEPIGEIDWEAVQREPLLRGLREWLDGADFLPDEADEVVEDLVSLFSFLRERGKPIEQPADVEMVSWLIDDAESAEQFGPLDEVALAIDALVHFQMATSANPQVWREVHDRLGHGGPADVDLGMVLKDAEAQTKSVPASDRLKAFVETGLYASTQDLLDWVGDLGQPVTGTGLPRRADIEAVAGLLGIEAKGVAKLPPPGEEGFVRHVQSILQIPEVLAWWDAATQEEFIEVTKTRVRLGERGKHLHAEEPWGIEDIDGLIEALVGISALRLCSYEVEDGRLEADEMLLGFVTTLLFAALRDEPTVELVDGVELAVQWRMNRALWWLESLCDLGILERHGEDFTVPLAWRAPVARGIYATVARTHEG